MFSKIDLTFGAHYALQHAEQGDEQLRVALPHGARHKIQHRGQCLLLLGFAHTWGTRGVELVGRPPVEPQQLSKTQCA